MKKASMSSPTKTRPPSERRGDRSSDKSLRIEEEISRFVSEGGDSATYASAAEVPEGTPSKGVHNEP